MMAICPVCGRMKCIHWPEHWVYRRGGTYYCGEQCMDTDLYRDMQLLNEVKRRRKGMTLMSQKITLEMKKKAVKIAISGKSPLPYLKNCGSTAPDKTWYAIKAVLKEKDPETYAKIPDFRQKPKTAGEAMEAAKDAADEFFGKCEDMGLNLGKDEVEIPEAKVPQAVEIPEEKPLDRIVGPCHIDKFLITAIRHPDLGEFYYDKKFQKVDWRTPEGDEISMSPAGWYNLLKDLPHVMRILGV